MAETNLGLDDDDDENDLERDLELDREREPDLERGLADFRDAGLELRLLSDILFTPSALTR